MTTVNNTPTTSCVDSNPSIPGCQIEIGVYCCIDEQGETDSFTCDVCAIWYHTCDFVALLEGISNINFSYQEVRNASLSRLNGFPFRAPYNRKKRFPDHVMYTKVSGEMHNHLKTLRNSLSYRSVIDRWMDKYPSLKLPDSVILDDVKQYNQAHVSYRESMTALKRDLNNCNNTYARISFERVYKVKWINGDAECIAEVRDMSFIRPRACCTFRDLREIADMNGWDNLLNTNDPYNYEQANVPESRFTQIQNINSNFPLPTSGFYLYRRLRGATRREVIHVTYDENCSLFFRIVGEYTAHNQYSRPIPGRPTLQEMGSEYGDDTNDE